MNPGVRSSAGVRSGNVPGSVNVFFKDLLATNFTLQDNQYLQQYFTDKGVRLEAEQAIIAYCGSGVTACVLLAALKSLGKENNVFLYDGSWCEYGKA